MIAAGQTLGMRRQVFMVSVGGFDTHANQMRDQPVLMARVAQASNYFLSALNTMGLLNNVTLFSASDFGRTLTSNGDGSDHGWGSHHFIAGGGVKGGTIHGQFPITALGNGNRCRIRAAAAWRRRHRTGSATGQLDGAQRHRAGHGAAQPVVVRQSTAADARSVTTGSQSVAGAAHRSDRAGGAGI